MFLFIYRSELTTGFRSDYTSTVTVLVGEGDVAFVVHQDLICNRSSFFKAACSKTWMDAREKTVSLPDHLPTTFKLYLEWAYSQTSDNAGLARAVAKANETNESNFLKKEAKRNRCICHELCLLWCLADYLGDQACKNEVIDNLLRAYGPREVEAAGISSETVVLVYQRTQPHSSVRKWLIDATSPSLTNSTLHAMNDSIPAAFFLELLKIIVDRPIPLGDEEFPTITWAYKYHEHVEPVGRCGGMVIVPAPPLRQEKGNKGA